MKSLFSSQDAARADDATLAALGRSVLTLATLARAGLAVPEWFLILPEAFQQCFSPWQLQALQQRRESGDLGALGELIARAILPAALAREIEDAARVTAGASAEPAGGGGGWLVRPLGLPFDFREPLQNPVVTTPQTVSERALALWRNALQENGAAARPQRGQWQPATVLVQRLAGGSAWGVASSADPKTGRRSFAVVEAFPKGDPDAAEVFPGPPANGVNGDRCRVSREDQILDRTPAAEEDRAMTAAQAVAAARLARSAAVLFGEPQRILWAADADGAVVILDADPLPGLFDLPDPDAPADEWLRGPVAELGAGAGGLVSPLSFSLIREALASAARALAGALEVPAERLAACEREGVLRRLLGQARGRLCLHLPSVRRYLDLLPDEGLARRAFEAAFVAPASPGRVAGFVPTPVRQALLALARQHRRLRRFNVQFARQKELALAVGQTPLDSQRPDELLAAWRALETLLQLHWQAPALNSYLALVCDGLLRELSARWCGDGALPNALLAGRAGERGDSVRPAEPAQRVREMAELVQNDDVLIDKLTGEEPINGTLDATLASRPRLAVQFGDFLEHFSLLAAPGHLLVETDDLRVDPHPLARAIGHYARGFRRAPYEPPTRGPDDAIRRAESAVQIALSGQRWRAFSYRWLLKQTRARLLEREMHGRTLAGLVAHARAIFLALGRRFRELGAVEHPADVFFLAVEEITGFLEGTLPGSDLRSLISSRRREAGENARLDPPAERFTTRGAFYRGNTFHAASQQSGEAAEAEEAPPGEPTTASAWRGVPGFPGIARGRARRVNDARVATLLQGEILVAGCAEPGWSPLLTAAGGIVLEHGSTVSRVAVIARELGIPTVFSAAGIFDGVRDGEMLELNGSTGTITRVRET